MYRLLPIVTFSLRKGNISESGSSVVVSSSRSRQLFGFDKKMGLLFITRTLSPDSKTKPVSKTLCTRYWNEIMTEQCEHTSFMTLHHHRSLSFNKLWESKSSVSLWDQETSRHCVFCWNYCGDCYHVLQVADTVLQRVAGEETAAGKKVC
jgi:hypothetical protein